MIRDSIEMLVQGRSLSRQEAAQSMAEIMDGEATPAQFGAFVTALRLKGETSEEITGMAQIMREKSLHVSVDGPMIDTCGTGGDGSGTFNISTTAGLVVAGSGVKVAKHGNRAMSGACGSADVLEALGVNIMLGSEGVKQCIDEIGFGFMFAQTFHPAMKYASAPRREIGIRTVFNILGPLTNPAGAISQVIGVANPAVGEKIAKVLGQLGSYHSFVVHGLDGLDEVSLIDNTHIWELKEGTVSSYDLEPYDFGLDHSETAIPKIGSAEESARAVRKVLQGHVGPERYIVLVNAAVALMAADQVSSLQEGVQVALESIDSGSAMSKLTSLVDFSQKLEY